MWLNGESFRTLIDSSMPSPSCCWMAMAMVCCTPNNLALHFTNEWMKEWLNDDDNDEMLMMLMMLINDKIIHTWAVCCMVRCRTPERCIVTLPNTTSMLSHSRASLHFWMRDWTFKWYWTNNKWSNKKINDERMNEYKRLHE